MPRYLTDEEVDSLPRAVYLNTPARLRNRSRWGWSTGRCDHGRGIRRYANPFVRLPNMPMHDSWNRGWDAAEQVSFVRGLAAK